MMLRNRQDLMWNAALIPETPVDSNVIAPTYDEAIQLANAGRPELVESLLALDINRLDVKLARENARPRIDAFANLTSAGLAGTPVPFNNPFGNLFSGSIGTVPSVLTGGASQSLSNITSFNFPTVQVGVTMSFPLRNRTALAQEATAIAEGRKIEAQQRQVNTVIETDVRNSLQAVNATRARLQAAGIASRSAEEQYQSEQRQFQAGTSSVFLVLQRQTDFINARNREVRARADFAESLAALDRATARTIQVHGITVR
jgi:outer membrane protein TolC